MLNNRTSPYIPIKMGIVSATEVVSFDMLTGHISLFSEQYKSAFGQ